VRPGTDGKQAAKLRLLAGLLGVGYDDLRQREQARQQRRLLWIASSSVVAALFTSGLAAYALIQRNEAVEQRDIARQKTLTAERTTDFVKSIFTVSDPSEAKGDVITARDILERGARRLENSLSDEPNVKAQLTTTLAEVYGGLGLYQRSDSLIRDSFSIKGRDRQTDLAQLIALGESQLRLGNYDAAVSTFQGAANRLSNTGTSARDQLSRALGGLTEAYASQDAVSAAEKSGMAALNSSRTTFGELNPSTARAYEALGLNSTFSGDLNTAKKRLEKALAIRLKTQGTLHPKVTELLSGLGSIAYLQREPDQAESYYLRAIASYDAVLGPNHPESATARQNLARVLLDQRKFSEAAPMFREAVATSLKERPATHDNLALAENGLGNLKVAEANFRRALIPARLHTHRNLAPILTDLASTLCAQKRYAEAVPLLDEAAPIMAKTYPNDPWRPAWVAQIRGQCLFAASKAAEGRALIRSSAAAITKRWPAGSLYGHIVAQNLKLAR
jgi:tetratricopeptide (TPR) repeat protein